MADHSPVITGLGVIGAPGTSRDEIWRAIAAGQSGLRPLSLFSSPRYGQIPVGEIPHNLTDLGAPPRGSRSDRLAWLAARDAIQSAHLDLTAVARRTGVLLGCSVGGSLGSEHFLATLLDQHKMRPRPTRFHECSSPVEHVAHSFGLLGPSFAISTACSSGALAIAAAADLIQSGEAEVMLAGGTDSLARTTWAGFHSLLLVDSNGCRPFDAARHGMSLGEGAGVLILESEAHARQRGATILARLVGWGASCDAHHVTAPHPEGAGALAAMQAALRKAQLQPGEIDYVNAHGTGTRDNDVAEARALRHLFGDNLPPFSSTKRCFGHGLAASGAIEAVVCVEALLRQQLPANPGFSEIDPAIGLAPVTTTRPAELTHALSNSFGFGGNNAALIFATAATTPRTLVPKSQPAFLLSFGQIAPDHTGPAEVKSPLPADSVIARKCGPFADAATLNPNQRRRLSRLAQMAVLAARRAGKPAADRRIAITLGTGFGCLDEGAVFVENLIAKNESDPMPTRFPGSVHNAPAGQVAIDLGARGLNSAPTAGEISFECALWQALHQFANDEADEVLAGGIDELNKYPLYLGKRWGAWTATHLPGEGAVFARLARQPTGSKPLARVMKVKLGRWSRPFDPAAEVDWIESGCGGKAVGGIVSGLGGWPELSPDYAEVIRGLEQRLGNVLERRTYLAECGNFPSASALGFVKAVELAAEIKQRVLLYTLALHGGKALCLIEP